MRGSAGKIQLASLDELFGTAQAPREPFQEIPLAGLHPFTGEANPLTGLLFCADCGGKMYNHKRGKQDYKVDAQPNPETGLYPSDYYNCSTYDQTSRRLEQRCCSHFITTKAIRALILDTNKTVSFYALSDEKSFMEKVRAASKIQQENAAKELKSRLKRNCKRSAELDNLIKKVYESYAYGKISEKKFEILSAGYEQEQEELEAAIKHEQGELDSFHADTDRADKFLELVKRHTDFYTRAL